jgi:hypothetical protein
MAAQTYHGSQALHIRLRQRQSTRNTHHGQVSEIRGVHSRSCASVFLLD